MSYRLLARSHETTGELGGERKLIAPFCELPKHELAVVRWLLWRYNDQTGECKPSDEDIAAGSALSEKTCTRARAALKRRGLIDWQERRSGGKRTSNGYRLADCLLTDTESVSPPELGDTESELPDILSPSNGQTGRPLTDTESEELKGVNVKGEIEGEKEGLPPNPQRGNPGEGKDRNGNGDTISHPAKNEQVRAAREAEQRETLAFLEAKLPKSTGAMRAQNERAIAQLQGELSTAEEAAPA
jgi:hypothetical protein